MGCDRRLSLSCHLHTDITVQADCFTWREDKEVSSSSTLAAVEVKSSSSYMRVFWVQRMCVTSHQPGDAPVNRASSSSQFWDAACFFIFRKDECITLADTEGSVLIGTVLAFGAFLNES